MRLTRSHDPVLRCSLPSGQIYLHQKVKLQTKMSRVKYISGGFSAGFAFVPPCTVIFQASEPV